MLKFAIFIFACILQIHSLSHENDHSIKVDILKYGIPCKLEWTPQLGGRSFPPSAVFMSTSNLPGSISFPIGRTSILGEFVAGAVQNDGFAHFYSTKEGITVKKSKFEILINPNNCHLEWNFLPLETTNYIFNTSETFVKIHNDTFVGRTKDEQNGWDICNILYNNQKCVTAPSANGKGKIKSILDFQILQSLTPRLNVKLENVSFSEKVELLDVQFTGTDRVLNKADVEISSSVSHSVSKSTGHTKDSSSSFSAGPPTASRTISESTSDDNDDSSDLDVSHDITVPSLTSVEFCSTTNMPSLSVQYEAVAIFSLPNVTARNIEQILIMEKYPGPFHISKEDGKVMTHVSEVKNGIQAAISSTFLINPVNAYQQTMKTCDSLKTSLDADRIRRLQSQLTQTGMNGVTQEELDKMIIDAYKGYRTGWELLE